MRLSTVLGACALLAISGATALAAQQRGPAVPPVVGGPVRGGAYAPDFKVGGVFALSPKERFAATDSNKDGKVSKDEFKAVLNPDAQRSINFIFANRDQNRDGWLTETEMNANGAGRGLPARAGAAGAAPKSEED